MIPPHLIDLMLSNAPAVGVLLYVAWQQQRLINLVVAICMRHLEEDSRDEISNT